ncbi:MAG TPA: spermidine/putrescine ABC transporter substrate-binding protein [Kineosporiaceae bacterium]|nr:spermidine/putrescine ABC transporter substrate-binding protein [Kineosporiaceae bacterium]
MSQLRRPRLTSEEAAIVRLMSGGRLSRRSVLTGAGALGMGAVLSACGTSAPGGGVKASAKPNAAADRSATDKVVSWGSWQQYLDYDEASKSYPTLADFTKQTGIKADYFEEIEDNASYYAKIQAQLHQGKDIQRDVVVLTDWMATRLVRDGLVQKLDRDKIPNIKNLRPELVNVAFDPGRTYSLTWQSGYTGIGYNVKKIKDLGIKPPTRVEDLWQPALKNRVMVLSEMRDTIGLIMLSQGKKPESFTSDDFSNALTVLDKQLNSGQIRQVVGNSYVDAMKSGDALMVLCWSGDVAQVNADLKAKDPTLTEDTFAFVKPEAGGMFWSDNMLIPVGSPHKQNAETLMNYYYDPKVAAKVAAWVNYVCPVQGARDEMAKIDGIDKALLDSPMIFPTQEYLTDCHVIRLLTAQEETDFTAAFQKVLGL